MAVSTAYINHILPKDAARVAIPGHVIQVVNSTTTTIFTGTLGAEVALFNFSITPTYITSKIFILVSFPVGITGNYNNYAASIKLRRGITTSGSLLQDTRFGQYQGGSGTYRETYQVVTLNALDAPSTSSSQSYCVTIANIDGSAYYESGRNQTNITLMEIAQ
jgi:hypothetical protein